MENKEKVDNIFLGIVIALLVFGLFSFISASFGILAKNEAKFAGVLFSQATGLIVGLVLMYVCARIPYKFWRNYAFYFFLASLLITLLVFVPGLGQKHGGATRWIDVAGFSFQPVEFLKISFIFYFAGWLSWVKSKAKELKYGVLPLLIILGIILLILLIVIVSNVKVVPQAHAYVIERLGTYHVTWSTGLHVKIPFIDKISKKVSLKEQVIDFPPQHGVNKTIPSCKS